jgi:hypothetical protein
MECIFFISCNKKILDLEKEIALSGIDPFGYYRLQ